MQRYARALFLLETRYWWYVVVVVVLENVWFIPALNEATGKPLATSKCRTDVYKKKKLKKKKRPLRERQRGRKRKKSRGLLSLSLLSSSYTKARRGAPRAHTQRPRAATFADRRLSFFSLGKMACDQLFLLGSPLFIHTTILIGGKMKNWTLTWLCGTAWWQVDLLSVFKEKEGNKGPKGASRSFAWMGSAAIIVSSGREIGIGICTMLLLSGEWQSILVVQYIIPSTSLVNSISE